MDETSVGVRAIENFFRDLAFLAVVGVNRNQDIAVFDLAFVLLGFVLGNSEADQRSGQSADRSARGRAARAPP